MKSQEKTKEIWKLLTHEERDKILKSEVLLDQGEQILFYHVLESKNDSLQKLRGDYLTLSEYLDFEKKTYKNLYETKDYFSVGFGLKLRVYGGCINRNLNSTDIHSKVVLVLLTDSIKTKGEMAKQFREKSLVSRSIVKAGESIHQANVYEQEAVILSEKALTIILKESKRESEMTRVESLQKVDNDSTSNFALRDNGAANLNDNKLLSLDSVQNLMTKVYYTVQIIADKKAIGIEEVRRIYDGEFQIVENVGDGWYRYSFGKFTDLSEAKLALSESKVKGYVVAYKGDKRIGIKEANIYFLNLTH